MVLFFQVLLKCINNHKAGPSSVSLILTEDNKCEYTLTVESPLICDMLQYTDENGLLSEKFEANFLHKLKSTSVHIEQENLDERIANGDD